MENQNDVEGHSLLGDQHFLVAVNDEVTSLIIPAFLGVLDSLLFAQIRQMTELGADHHWNLTDRDLILLEDLRLLLDLCPIILVILDLQDLNCAEDLSLIRQTSNPSGMRHDGLVGAVTFVQARELIHSGTTKDYFVGSLLIVVSNVLPILLDGLLAKFLDDLLDGVLKEPFERKDLLGYEAILFEVTVNDLPAIVLVNRLDVEFSSIAHLGRDGLLSLHY